MSDEMPDPANQVSVYPCDCPTCQPAKENTMNETWTPSMEINETTGEHDIPPSPISAVYQAIGSATRPDIWGPDGVFQEQRACAIADGLIDFLRANPLDPVSS